MKYIQTDFSKELSSLLLKHKKIIESDKSGMYVVDTKYETDIIIAEAETASEDYRNKLMFIIKQ